jgi:murein DD-endopeptidase MepM/ murein hydrolase activator NlpD
MNSAFELICSWPGLRAIALGLAAMAMTGCSESTRFADFPYGPRSGQADTTGSIESGQGAPVGRVETKPLPSAPHSTPVAYSAAETTGAAKGLAPKVPKPAEDGQWNWDGGTAITVAPGETLEAISHRHGVPVSAILEANNLASAHAIQVGQRLVIPHHNATTAAGQPASHVAAVAPGKLVSPPPAAAAPPTAAPATPANAAGHAAGSGNGSGVHVVAAGDTLTRIAHHYGKSVAEITKANNIAPSAKLSIADRILIPGLRTSAAKPEPDHGPAASKPAGKDAASAAPVQTIALATPSSDPPGSDSSMKAGLDASPGFRWPVHGRIIAAFGQKPNGQQNDGIDVAVPENTPVKAAEDGVVAYAGSELKGYGNLVLVRHANGYVTAYAHAKELLVKRGDQIKRGQVIAKSGQSGNAEVPQLHFEVRRGSAPVDPMQFLNGT